MKKDEKGDIGDNGIGPLLRTCNFGHGTSTTGTTTVTVTVNSIDELTVPATVAITLETVDGTDPQQIRPRHSNWDELKA
ncbi:hypothetical protein [Acetomicrobium sp.]|uniref:hypothetical protein n=1 Tax=Acetomicrobium sp. TaxID=1872099 RepID=UPI003D985B61